MLTWSQEAAGGCGRRFILLLHSMHLQLVVAGTMVTVWLIMHEL
jgi:hypothetical protein